MYLAMLLVVPFLASAQEEAKVVSTTYFSNALFITLLVVILVLLILILAMASVFKNLTQSNYFQEKYKAKNNNSTNIIPTILLTLFTLVGYQAVAQDGAVPQTVAGTNWLVGGLDSFTFYFMISIIFIEGLCIFLLFNLIKGFIKIDKAPDALIDATPKVSPVKEKTILEKLNASVDIEKESEIMLNHDYDGIRELDNNLPPWWKYGFYLTIAISVIYLIHFHVSKTGDLQGTEYTKSIAAAKVELDEYMKTSANNVDETTVKMLEGDNLIAGKEVYIANCVACHGKLGEGGVGPNLTDAYWLHSGGISDIFKTIKYGIADKGMKAWKEDLSPMQMAQLSSYIKTLSGTNPPNGKAAQGELYTETAIVQTTDTLSNSKDSLKTNELPKDSSLTKLK